MDGGSLDDGESAFGLGNHLSVVVGSLSAFPAIDRGSTAVFSLQLHDFDVN